MIVAVLSKPGREGTSFHTFANLARQNPGWPHWIYRSPLGDGIGEFWRLLQAARGHDLLAVEDDIVTARNFFSYAAAWSADHVTSFFHCGRPVLGEPVSAQGFSMTQAVKIPARVGAALCDIGPGPRGGGQDDALGRRLPVLGELVIYHRSLVQHVGARTISWGPGTTLEGRTALDFPGEDFDCMGARR